MPTIAVLTAASLGIGALILVLASTFVRAGDPLPAAPVTPSPVPTILPTAGRASVKVFPAEASPGTRIAVTGAGWQPSETVAIHLNDPSSGAVSQITYGTGIARADGTFVTSFIYPAHEPWAGLAHVLVTAASDASGARASARLDVQATTATVTATPPPAHTQEPAPPTETATPPPVIAAWRGEYHDNPELAGSPALVRNDDAVRFDWGDSSPAGGLPADGFSARWTRTVRFDEGTYKFHLAMDDGARLYLDNQLVIDAWQDGPPRMVTTEVTVADGEHLVRVEYFERGGGARIEFWWEGIDAPSYTGWKGEYWAGREMSSSPVLVRNDDDIGFDWKDGSPGAGLPNDDFSARWTRTVTFEAGEYEFHLVMDDGARLWVDGELAIDGWEEGGIRRVATTRSLAQGRHDLRVEYFEREGDARIVVWWKRIAPAPFPEWRGEYWPNPQMDGDPALIRNDEAVAFDWGKQSPTHGLPSDGFSARWSRQVTFEDGLYRFIARADDGIRLRVDGTIIIDEWHTSSGGELYVVELALSGPHELVVDYYDQGGDALVELDWEKVDAPTSTPDPTPTPAPLLTPTVTPSTTLTFPPILSSTLTGTLTPAGTPTVTPTIGAVSANVTINEVLPAPSTQDWDGDGSADDQDEWIELYNAGTQPVDLSGWMLDDAGGDSAPYRIPSGTVLPPSSYVVFYRAETGIALDDAGDRVQLYGLGGNLLDVISFGELGPDVSYSQGIAGFWLDNWPPSPGGVNLPLRLPPWLRRLYLLLRR